MAQDAGIDGTRRGNASRAIVWGAAAFLLLLPLAAMQVTAEVAWDAADFVLMGALLLAACGGYELAARASGGRTHRAAVAAELATAFLLVWTNLAVGLIGSERDPANLLFAGVLAVAAAGAFTARLRPAAMARAMLATAAAQGLVAALALAAGWTSGVLPTLFFVPLWLGSAWLFRRAARD